MAQAVRGAQGAQLGMAFGLGHPGADPRACRPARYD